ncbi:FAD-binding oxidoreductase [Phenylobacterium sp. LjRoot164]|uniref:NAD(P)/FAD-dependent oxidoreductase n=1 Tax=unclassified Phenylobacterium TaxID=2640670 RepID=UPI003ED01402
MAQCDVVVVGAGIAGAGVAAELSGDLKVVLLEQEAQPGMHATGRSAALHSEIYGNACIRALTRAGRSFLLKEKGGRSFMRPRGCLHIATSAQLGRLETMAAEPGVGAGVRRIEGAALREKLPLLRDAAVAALEENHAYDIDVDALHGYFLRRHRAHGGLLRCTAPVSAITRSGGLWAVTAGGETFHAPTIINAAGAWGDQVAGLAGVAAIGLQPMRRSALIVDAPPNADPASWPAVIDIDEQFYFKPDAGRILMSPADETPSLPCDAYPDDLDLAVAVDRVQQVADIPVRRIVHSWAGLRTFAPDRTPVVGFDPTAEGFFWLTGQGGYGIQTSPALSRLAAALVRERQPPADLIAEGVRPADLDPARLRRAPSTTSTPIRSANS